MSRRQRRTAPRDGTSVTHASHVGSPRPSSTRSPSPILIFSLLTTACFVIAVGYATYAGAHVPRPIIGTDPAPASATGQQLAITDRQPAVLFRGTALDSTYGGVMLAPLDDPEHPLGFTGLQCERVYFAAGRGLCLAIDRGIVTRARALSFDDHFHVLHDIPLNGIPSRARLSPSGHLGATTTFVSGHSYAANSFSTETTLLDVPNGVPLGTLEEFEVWRDGSRIQSPDFNFWGVTFAGDDERFYATLATGGKTYLVQGSIAGRSVWVLHEGVECPSLSPDESRVAFKRRVNRGGPIHWQPYVLDLSTLQETALAEDRTIDDQIEWLDDGRILYALPVSSPSAVTHVWTLPADGSGRPERFLENAASPAVVRMVTSASGAEHGTTPTGSGS
jgi:hypothetical protein